MLICLGGAMGTGRRALARELARISGYHIYDINEKKMRSYVVDKKGLRHEVHVLPKTDKARVHLYQKVLDDMSLQSKMHTDMIIEGSFHRRRPRKFLLKHLKAYFDRVLFVWVTSDETSVAERLKNLEEKGRIGSIETARKRSIRMQDAYEPPRKPSIIFHYDTHDLSAADKLWSVIQDFVRTTS